ncbi:Derlin [Mycena kentingensis (nom. inval.)]|nr:Derlin [Mycena kentingensis (nom. inval.)]
MDDLIREVKKIPPVTRLVLLSSLGVTVPCMLHMISTYHVVYSSALVVRNLEIWRIYTSFFYGGGGLGYIFDLTDSLSRTMDQLETTPYRKKSADLAWQLLVSAVGIFVTSIPLRSPYRIFWRPLCLAIVYIGSRLAPLGAQTSIFGLVTVPVRYMPYIMLAFDALSGPEAIATALPGAIIGHLWWWGVWGSAIGGGGGILSYWARAPRWFADWMGQERTHVSDGPGAGVGSANAGRGVQIIPPRRMADDPTPAGPAATGYNWGRGNRLGN